MQKVQDVWVPAHFLEQAENGQLAVPKYILNYVNETNLIHSNIYHKYTVVTALVSKSFLYCNVQNKI